VTLPQPLLIEAVVADSEQHALVAASEQLSECLGAASGIPWPGELRFCATLDAIGKSDRPSMVIASLLPELGRAEEPVPSIVQRWHRELAPILAAVPYVFICTAFRHIATGGGASGHDPSGMSIERLRRLNMAAIELSHDTGAFVIDIDAVLAHLGARSVSADFRLASAAAAEAAGYVIASSILGVGADDCIPPEIQERAKQHLGGTHQLVALIQRRLREKAQRARRNG